MRSAELFSTANRLLLTLILFTIGAVSAVGWFGWRLIEQERNPQLDAMVHPLHLAPTQQRALAAFLRALNGSITEGR